MNQPTIDERLDFWRYAYSRVSFIEARQTTRFLLQVQNAITEDHRTALITALVVTYTRPFTVAQITTDRRIIPMHDMPVPSEHNELHGTFLVMRHKVFGHKDATGPDTGGGVLNEVCFVVKDGYVDLHTVKVSYYDPEKLQETCVLTNKLISYLDSKIADLMEKYPFPASIGWTIHS